MCMWAANGPFNTTENNKLEKLFSTKGNLPGEDKQASALLCKLQEMNHCVNKVLVLNDNAWQL